MLSKKEKAQIEELTYRLDCVDEELEKIVKSLNTLANRLFAHERKKEELPRSKTLGDVE